MTVRISFVRHGRTPWNLDRRLLGWTDIGLDGVGEQQARDLGARLDMSPYERIVSSDLSRATATARLAGWTRTEADWRLREIDFGELEGLTWDSLAPEVREGLIAFDGFTAPGGESTADFVGRVVDALEGFDDGTHMVVTHGGVIRAVLRQCGQSGTFPDHVTVYTVDWGRRKLLDVHTPTV
ncbi:MAG: histidine phosphatase family protein [Acidimicrobiia bacterium]|nr:histidine phosphatase family protein [Acidimicrobiia bacterium]